MGAAFKKLYRDDLRVYRGIETKSKVLHGNSQRRDPNRVLLRILRWHEGSSALILVHANRACGFSGVELWKLSNADSAQQQAVWRIR